MNKQSEEEFKQWVLANAKKVVGEDSLFPECPSPPPCEYCGRVVYAGVCCDEIGRSL